MRTAVAHTVTPQEIGLGIWSVLRLERAQHQTAVPNSGDADLLPVVRVRQAGAIPELVDAEDHGVPEEGRGLARRLAGQDLRGARKRGAPERRLRAW